jgi:D-alanyl-D-alanine carboxypeptidase
MTSNLLARHAVAPQIDLLSAWIEGQIAYAGQPGLSIGVVYNQELVWAQGFGHANVERRVPATAATLYRIASITKLFTATAIMILRDEGRLQLDDPVSRYLPWFSIQNQQADSPPITIRHLLTHTSGLPREAAFPYWDDSVFPSREQIIESLPRQSTIYATETRWKYSNLALTLAGEIVMAVSGQVYAEFVQQRILDPLGMVSSRVCAPDPNDPQLATGYGRRLPDGSRALSPFTDCKGLVPAANMSTSVEDLARFAMLQFRDGPAGGAQILRGSTLREMQRVHWLDPNWQMGWGLGFRISRQKDKTYLSHGGAVLGYRTDLVLCPADKVACIVLTNADDGNPAQHSEKVFQWVAPAIAKAKQPEPPGAEPRPEWQRFVGRYRSAWGDTHVLILNGELVAIGPALPDPMPFTSKLEPVGENTFRIQSEDGGAAVGELVVFESDAEGKVVRVKIGENSTHPIEAW